MSGELLKTTVIVLLIFTCIIVSAIAIVSPEVFPIHISRPHITAQATTTEIPITNPETIFMLAATFLIAAMFLGILLVIVALKTY